MNYKKIIAKLVKEQNNNIDIEFIENIIEIPVRIEVADFALPCFKIREYYNKSPDIIAEELKNNIISNYFEKIESSGAYLNFFINKALFIKNTLEEIISSGDDYGYCNIGNGKCIFIQYSFKGCKSILNIRDAFNPIIANYLYKLHKKQGYEVVLVNDGNGFDLCKDKISNIESKLRKENLIIQCSGFKGISLKEYNMPPFILSNERVEVTNYAYNLLNIIARKSKYKFNKYIYIDSISKKTEYKQLFKVLEIMGYEWGKKCEYFRLGLVKFNNCVIEREEFKEKAEKAIKAINKKYVDLKCIDSEERRVIDYLIFIFTKNKKGKNVSIDFQEMFLLKKDSLEYIKEVYYKNKKVLKNNGYLYVKSNYYKVASNKEYELVKALKEYKNIINSATETLETSIIIEYVLYIIKLLDMVYSEPNNYLEIDDINIIKERLMIIEAVCIIIRNSLNLLGIENI